MPFIFLLFLLQNLAVLSNGENQEFAFNGFKSANLTLDGTASITSDGLLRVASLSVHQTGHAFYPSPLRFKKPSPDGAVFSFSTTFVFGIIPELKTVGGQGLAFLISPTKDFSKAYPDEYLGLFDPDNNGHSSNHVLAVELDIIESRYLNETDGNHVGIDINSIISYTSHLAGYYEGGGAGAGTGSFKNLALISGQAMQIWVDYDGDEMRLNVTLAPVRMAKPRMPLLSAVVDLATVFSDSMYVGFSASLGSYATSHYVLGWSFKMNGTARAIDYHSLSSLPRRDSASKALVIGLPVALAGLLIAVVGAAGFLMRRRFKYAELLEDWEDEYGPHRLPYRDLFNATKGFKDEELLGRGGFGRVYRGVLPSSRSVVAVKRVSADSSQGLREFIAEVVSLGRLRHRNLVQLLGYCRRKGELLLVYDYMPNGSLDRFLYDRCKPALDWASRLRIIKGVAAGLLYLHEEWEKVVVHRDIKSSNVLIDNEINGRLSDFGLARLYDHGADPHATSIVGTMGYLAPELARTGKASTATDVFAFGTFVLEVTCGRRPVGTTVVSGGRVEPLVLLDWVVENWRNGTMLETRDPRLGDKYVAEELELVMTLGLLCANPLARERPSIRKVVQCLLGEAPLPELSAAYVNFNVVDQLHIDGFDGHVMPYPSTSSSVATASVVSKFSRGAIFPSAPDPSGRGFESSQVEVAV